MSPVYGGEQSPERKGLVSAAVSAETSADAGF